MPTQGGKLHPKKYQESNQLSTNSKEDKHTNIKISKITGSNNHYSLLSFNINGLNSPIKRHRLPDWIHKQDSAFCCIQETPPRHYFRVKGWKTIFQANAPKETSWGNHSIIG